jgi:hypothetical protein
MTNFIYIIQSHDDSSPQALKICATLEAAKQEREKMIREDYEENKRFWTIKYDGFNDEYRKRWEAVYKPEGYTFKEYRDAVAKVQGRYGSDVYDDPRFGVFINVYDIVEKELLE